MTHASNGIGPHIAHRRLHPASTKHSLWNRLIETSWITFILRPSSLSTIKITINTSYSEHFKWMYYPATHISGWMCATETQLWMRKLSRQMCTEVNGWPVATLFLYYSNKLTLPHISSKCFPQFTLSIYYHSCREIKMDPFYVLNSFLILLCK